MRSKRIKPPEGGKGGQASETEIFCGNRDRLPGGGSFHGGAVGLDKPGSAGGGRLGRADLPGCHVHGAMDHGAEKGTNPEAHKAAVLRSEGGAK